MFGKPPREPQKPEMSELQDIELTPEITIDTDDSPQDTELQPELRLVQESELVSTVEKISRIVSPYFVVITGLVLYENNFVIGSILIIIGILSLLKISTQDVAAFLEWLKNFFGLGNK